MLSPTRSRFANSSINAPESCHTRLTYLFVCWAEPLDSNPVSLVSSTEGTKKRWTSQFSLLSNDFHF